MDAHVAGFRKRRGSSISALKVKAVMIPTPGMVISRLHTASILQIDAHRLSSTFCLRQHGIARGQQTERHVLEKAVFLGDGRFDFRRKSGGSHSAELDAECLENASDVVLHVQTHRDQLLASANDCASAWPLSDFTCVALYQPVRASWANPARHSCPS